MISPDYLRTLFAYHEWATLRVLNTAAQLDPPALDATPLAGLGSLRQILVHALSADYAADGRIIISYRPSAAAGEREPDGRLFTAIPPGELALLLESAGLAVLHRESRADEARPSVTWHTLVAQKRSPDAAASPTSAGATCSSMPAA